jgi:predicted short-subunit dehydrogenase-like oxidoreductase (DUF2520 family)
MINRNPKIEWSLKRGTEMGIGFIGAGKVATAFGRHLHARGIPISGYFDRHDDKVAHASQITSSHAWRSAAEAADGSDILLITTRDDQIAGVCQSLCRGQHIGSQHLMGHMSGVHTSLILSAAARQGAAIFSLHPLQAFADEEKALADLPHTYFSLEGRDERLSAIETLLKRSGNRYFCIDPMHKPLYHLAACILSNYLVTLMADGMTALEQSGINPQEGFQAMRPLIEGTLANIAQTGPARALTGPIARGDAGTIAAHLTALDHHGLNELKENYIFMGLKTLELATQTMLKDPEKVAALHKLLTP